MQSQQELELLAKPPVSRAADGGGSFDAEDFVNSTGLRAQQQRQVLRAFACHPKTTTKQLAELMGWDRHMVGRRAPDLLFGDLVQRAKGIGLGNREWRWELTAKGEQLLERIGRG